jgi:hypothetical protein
MPGRCGTLGGGKGLGICACQSDEPGVLGGPSELRTSPFKWRRCIHALQQNPGGDLCGTLEPGAGECTGGVQQSRILVRGQCSVSH